MIVTLDPPASVADRPATPLGAVRDWVTPALALLGAAAAFVVGFVDLGKRDLWNDEFATWHGATLSAHQARMFIGNIDLVHGFYYLLVRGWMVFAGDSPAGLRFLSLLAVSATAALIVVLGGRLFDRAVGAVAALVYVALPVTSRYAQEARSYALVTCGAVLATWLLLRALERPARRHWWLYGASIVAVGWLHFVALLVLAGHLFYVWRTAGGPDRRWQWTTVTGTSTLFVLPLLVLASGQSGQISWIKGDWTAVRKVFAELVGGVPMLAVVVLFLLLGAALAAQRRPAVFMLVIWAVLPPVFGYATFTLLHLFMARYFLFTVPAVALLVAFGAVHSGRLVARPVATAAGLAVGLAVVAGLAFAGLPAQRTIRTSTLEGQPSYVAATRYIAEHAQPGDGVAFNDGFGGPTDLARKATDYQFRNQSAATRPRDVFLAQAARDRGWLTALECADQVTCLGDTQRVWLIETGHIGNQFEGLPPSRANLLQSAFTVKHLERFEKVRVVELVRKSPH
ncbi:glycosyltransferase family 39 protein [Dactylosporangium sp. NPDC051484]|uniref:glycosyltransferase family 39 protein n=1 Tax=Dactylosporangium sp. NPDC051484 TaxID=3154942 RepID=UPI00344D0A1F